MPRKRNAKPPSYCCHKASGRAVVRINGRDRYLGTYGSPESHAAYERLIAEWRANQHRLEAEGTSVERVSSPALTIAEMLLRYREFARDYYSKGGEATKEFVEMRYALRPVRLLYGDTLAREFGPLKLKAVRQHMIDAQKLSRGVVNNRVNRIRRAFRWAVSEELIPPSVIHGLNSVEGLRRGRTSAPDPPPVEPVPDVWVDAVLPFLSPVVAAMVQLQRLTGMRPGEVVCIRACDIEMDGDVWVYRPDAHKTDWRGHSRAIPIGPKGQELVREFMTTETTRYLFSPRDAEVWRNEERARRRNPNRKTPIYPSELRARERRKAASRRRIPKRPKRERYSVDSYWKAIQYAIEKANKKRAAADQPAIPAWCPLQLRHSRGTEVRKRFGIEAAQVVLGHVRADVTEVYAERNLDLAIQIARKTGSRPDGCWCRTSVGSALRPCSTSRSGD